MGSQQRREREKDEVRTRILDAARELFVEEGYDAVSMRKIAAKIDYTATALYFHFKDKLSLLSELCARDFAALARKLGSLERIDDPVKRLRRLGQGYIEFALDHPNHYRLMFMTPRPVLAPDKIPLERGNPEQDAYGALRDTVAEAIAKGRLRPELKDSELVAQTLWAGTHGVVALEIAKRGDPWVDWRPMKKRARLMTAALLRGLVRDPDDIGAEEQ